MKQFLGYKFYDKDFESFKSEVALNEKMFIVTANPEITQNKSKEFVNALNDSSHIVADGIGLVIASKIKGVNLPERIPGVELMEWFLGEANRHQKSVLLYGAKLEVIELLVNRIKSEYPKINLVGAYDGYNTNKDELKKTIIEIQPDYNFVALGMPNQEVFISSIYSEVDRGIYMGVGGSFDVLSGTKKRAPNFMINLRLEWLYRLLCEPQRIKKFVKSIYYLIASIIKSK